MVTKACFVGEGFTRKPPKYERFIRPMVRNILLTLKVKMRPNAPFVILLCLMAGNFTCQGQGAAMWWVK
jgi:hypothetical protein